MMGIPVQGPVYIYGNNQLVLANMMIPNLTLKKKIQSIAYHFIREGAAQGEWCTTYINIHLNKADLMTKCLPSGLNESGPTIPVLPRSPTSNSSPVARSQSLISPGVWSLPWPTLRWPI